jgi:hydrogenase nickel incorporation protein HypA/HybF
LTCLWESSFPGFVKSLRMHEIKIAEDLSSIVLEAARGENLSKVTKINISFGQLVQIVPDIFEFAFREVVRNSVVQDAELNIEIVPVKMRCLNCRCDFQLKKNRFTCTICGSNDLEIITGKELFIKSIEGE